MTTRARNMCIGLDHLSLKGIDFSKSTPLWVAVLKQISQKMMRTVKTRPLSFQEKLNSTRPRMAMKAIRRWVQHQKSRQTGLSGLWADSITILSSDCFVELQQGPVKASQGRWRKEWKKNEFLDVVSTWEKPLKQIKRNQFNFKFARHAVFASAFISPPPYV